MVQYSLSHCGSPKRFYRHYWIEDFCDLNIECGNNSWSVHRIVLCAGSAYFDENEEIYDPVGLIYSSLAISNCLDDTLVS